MYRVLKVWSGAPLVTLQCQFISEDMCGICEDVCLLFNHLSVKECMSRAELKYETRVMRTFLVYNYTWKGIQLPCFQSCFLDSSKCGHWQHTLRLLSLFSHLVCSLLVWLVCFTAWPRLIWMFAGQWVCGPGWGLKIYMTVSVLKIFVWLKNQEVAVFNPH